MATQSTLSSIQQSRSEKSTFLRRALIGNVVFSVTSAGGFIIAANQIAEAIGISDFSLLDSISGATLLRTIGIGLLIFAVQVFLTASKKPISNMQVNTVIVMDVLWVVGSFLLLVTDALALTTTGNWGVLIIADIVLTLAALQFYGLRRMNR